MPLPPLPAPGTPGSRAAAVARGVAASFCLFSCLLVINFLQMASLLVRPFSVVAFRRFNRFVANFWWSFCHIWADRLHGSKVVITGDNVPAGENALVICNHQEMTDIPVLFALAYAKGRLGDMKWVVKDIIKYVPGPGWGMLFLDCIFVKRDWMRDRARVEAAFAHIHRARIPVWMISFVEGTRLTPAKHEASLKYARDQGMAPLRHLLVPRTKGFIAMLHGLRGQVDAVYDVTIGYVGGTPNVWQWLEGVPKRVNMHVVRIPVASLPETDEAVAAWVMERFYIKDRLLEHYYRTGGFAQ